MKIFIMFFLMGLMHHVFAVDDRKWVDVHTSRLERALAGEKFDPSMKIRLNMDSRDIPWKVVLQFLKRLLEEGGVIIELCEGNTKVDISSHGMENDLKVVSYDPCKAVPTGHCIRGKVMIRSSDKSKGFYTLLYWTIPRMEKREVREQDVVHFSQKVASLNGKPFGLGILIDQDVSVGTVFRYLSILNKYSNCMGILFFCKEEFDLESLELSPDISVELE